jgi:lysyl-tRNA synthetase class 2
MADKAEEFKKMNAQEKEVQQRETADGKKEFLDEETGEWVSKNELKKRQTQRKNAAKAAEKAAKKKEDGDKKPAASKKAGPTEEETELDPSQYTEIRKNFLEGLRQEGKNPYPHKFQRDMTIPQFREKYEQVELENGQFVEDQKIALTGRIMGLRNQGAKLIFIDLQEDGQKV